MRIDSRVAGRIGTGRTAGAGFLSRVRGRAIFDSRWLHRIGLAATFLAVFAITGHIYQHSLKSFPLNIAKCEVCKALSVSSAPSALSAPEPVLTAFLVAERDLPKFVVHGVTANSGRSPPASS